jgi:hypothetical protein
MSFLWFLVGLGLGFIMGGHAVANSEYIKRFGKLGEEMARMRAELDGLIELVARHENQLQEKDLVN